MNHILILLIWRQTIWGQIRNGWEGGKPPPVESCRGGDLYLLLPPVGSLRLRTFSSGNVAKLPSSLSSSVSETLHSFSSASSCSKCIKLKRYGEIRKVKSLKMSLVEMSWVTAIIFTGEKKVLDASEYGFELTIKIRDASLAAAELSGQFEVDHLHIWSY